MEEEISPIKITNNVWIVPCRLDQSSKKYKPLYAPLKDQSHKRLNRKCWSKEEDEKLNEIVLARGPKQWSAIAIELNQTLHYSKPMRKGKQCRERWLGHLSPDINKSTWTAEEDSVLMFEHSCLGNQWSEIAKLLPGRTENQIKNRWKRLKNEVKSSQTFEALENLSAETKEYFRFL